MTPPTEPGKPIACRVSIGGVVQGVGLRPFVYRTAVQHHVAGWVFNGDAGVEIHAQAPRADLERFLHDLRELTPPAAAITQFTVCPAIVEQLTGFQICDSRLSAAPTVRIAPDLGLCADCLAELFDPANRRHLYPYINCTNCGPRYSIIQRLPYDRPGTTMAPWPMCPACQAEYDDPRNRRHHAQPTACDACGPGYRLMLAPIDPVGTIPAETLSGDQAIRRAAELLRDGGIVAVKGIGGYHLACDASNAAAVSELRLRKYRKEQPFAVMVRSLDEARRIVRLSDAHERLLDDVARPIVLAEKVADLPGIAPETDRLGVMLPYTPLHHLLFARGAPSPLVMTSGNRSSEPIAYHDDDAIRRLSGIADAFLVGERPIARRVDDSVVAIREGQTIMIRRSRGFAPGAVCQLPAAEPILALGGDLKNTIALVVQGQVFVSQHIGDLGDFETNQSFEQTVSDLLAMYQIRPEDLTVVHDLHPQFHSTRFAERLPSARRIGVQHHQAHIASVLAEQGLLDERVVGIAFDGTGYGTDGTIWGGELFIGSVRHGFERQGSLRPVRMPGGDAAARFPVQAAAGFLADLKDLPDMTRPPFEMPRRFTEAWKLVERDMRCFVSTSVGRLYDAVAALLGFIGETTFEGQAAIWLEHQARQSPPQPPYPFPDLDPRPLLTAILQDRLAGRGIAQIAAAFHAGLATATAEQAAALCQAHDLQTVVLSGGVFQNELLVNLFVKELNQRIGARVLMNRLIPANDGGLCVGQAALAWAVT